MSSDLESFLLVVMPLLLIASLLLVAMHLVTSSDALGTRTKRVLCFRLGRGEASGSFGLS